MSNIVDRVFAEVCLDERITDGVFKMDEEEHMNALRDYFVKKGITKEAAVNVTNRMVEGKYPDRQAYRKEDGILVTWPSPQHKANAFKENPGKYIEQNPFPKKEEPEPREPVAPEKEEPEDDEPIDKPSSDNGPRTNNLFDREPESVPSQGGKQLAVEPPRGDEKPQPVSPAKPAPTPTTPPRTPQVVAAEKEVVKQIMKTDDTTLSNVANPINEACHKQLSELYKRADELGYKEAITFLTPYVRP